MKNLSIILFLLLSISVSNIVNANTVNADKDNREQDSKVLKSYLSTFEQALNNNDIKQIIPLLKDDVVIVFVNAEVATGITEVVAYHEKVLGNSNALLKTYSTKAVSSGPARFSNNTAIAHGTALDTYTLANNDVIEMQTVWNVTLVKDDVSNEWKIAQLHFSANPFSNSVMDAIEGKIILVGSICGIIGLLLGLLIRRFRKKTPL